MESNRYKLKSWGYFLAGFGILLIGIAALITVIRCPERSKFMDFFGRHGTSTVTRTFSSSDTAPPIPITSSQRKLTDEEFDEIYAELKKGLSESELQKIILEGIESEEFKKKLRESLEDAPLILQRQKFEKIN
jgi:hypothetical protein